MAASATERPGRWGDLAATLLPALVMVLGGQACRALVAHVQAQTWLGPLLLAGLLVLPLGRVLADGLGTRRAAGLAALALVLARLVAALAGPALAGWYGLVGTVLFAACLDLLAADEPQRRPRAQALLLGASLSLLDRLFSDGYDFLWQTGASPVMATVLLSAPLLILALGALRESPGPPARTTPASLAWPLVVAALLFVANQPARLATAMGWPFARAILLLAAANFGAAVALFVYERLLLGQWRRRAQHRGGRRWHVLATGLVGSAFLAGLVFADGEPVLALFGPVTMALAWVTLGRARPIGRRRRLDAWCPTLVWLVLCPVATSSVEWWWPAALCAAAVMVLSWVAMFHQERAGEPEPAPWWLAGAHGLVLLVALLSWVRGLPPAADLQPDLARGGLRLLVSDIDAGRGADGVPDLTGAVALLRELHPKLIVLRDAQAGTGTQFDDPAGWLAGRSGLGLFTKPEQPAAVLAPARPVALRMPRPGLVVAVWKLGDSVLGLATVREAAPGAALSTAVDLLQPCPRRIIAAHFEHPPASWWAPLDYRRATEVTATGGEYLWLGPHVTALRDEPQGQLRRPGLTALLEIRP